MKCIRPLVAIVLLGLTFSQAEADGVEKENADSSRFNGMFVAQGMFQKGNLNQTSANVEFMGNWIRHNSAFQMAGSYSYVHVQGFTVIHDFWNHGQYRHYQGQRAFLSGLYYVGTALSFGIEQAYTGGVGWGYDLLKPSPDRSLSLTLSAGYTHLTFMHIEERSHASGLAVIRAHKILGANGSMANFDAHYYQGLKETDSWGLQSNFTLSIPIQKGWFLRTKAQLIVSRQVDEGKEPVNMIQMVGLQKSF